MHCQRPAHLPTGDGLQTGLVPGAYVGMGDAGPGCFKGGTDVTLGRHRLNTRCVYRYMACAPHAGATSGRCISRTRKLFEQELTGTSAPSGLCNFKGAVLCNLQT